MTLIRRGSDAARSASAFGTVRADVTFRRTKAQAVREDPRDAALVALRAECDALRDELAAARDAAEEAREAAYAKGLNDGRAAAESLERERLDQLGAALRDAQSGLDAHLTGERDLAVEIALAALRRVIGDPAHYRDLVSATARLNAAALERSTVVRLAVSPADFTDPAELEQLGRTLGQIAVELDSALEAGGCRFDLALGQVDAAIPAQAAGIEAQLIQPQALAAERA